MIKQNYNVIGVMSGTSLDGIDIACINFEFNGTGIAYKMPHAATIRYSSEWLARLKNAVSFNKEELVDLDRGYTRLLGGEIKRFIDLHAISSPDAICSHGHTVLHQPQDRITLQIGNLPEIAAITGQRVICDFRVQDVAMGGQGAPLVPLGDALLFSGYDFCLNLGGFSNISFSAGDKRVAYDICAVNTVLNYYANRLGYEYDDRGAIARSGTVHVPLLTELNNLDYYNLPYPKSLGFEFVKMVILPMIESYDIPLQDKLATFTEHVAVQLAGAINKEGKDKSVLITGGGAYNDYLIELLTSKLRASTIVIPDDKTVQYKEALIFGLLGVLRYRGEINVLSDVTGAPHDHCAGYVYGPI